MPRWVAICTGWESGESVDFLQELSDSSDWRLDARTTITTAFVLTDGRILIECHGREEERFKTWLDEKSLAVESISIVQKIAKLGNIWDVK